MNETPCRSRDRATPEDEHRHQVDGQPSTAVVHLVANVLDRDPTEMPPLYRVVDTAALDAFVRPTDPSGACVAFTYAGYEVVVHDDGELVATPVAE